MTNPDPVETQRQVDAAMAVLTPAVNGDFELGHAMWWESITTEPDVLINGLLLACGWCLAELVKLGLEPADVLRDFAAGWHKMAGDE